MTENTSSVTRNPELIFVGVAWPYASGPRHLGHAAGAYVPPDVFARYHRMTGNRVLMVSGSDMHGTPITVVADQRGVGPREVAEENHRGIADSFTRLGLSYDLYTTTLTPTHYRVTQAFFLRLHEQGYLFEDTTTAMYDPEARRFLPDRYVEGTCPHCGYPDARGDQCDNCGRTLDPTDLIDPRSKLSGATPETRQTTHFFLDLPKFQEPLLSWVEANRDRWRPAVSAFVLGWLREGLKPRAITRDIDWGVPIPLPGWEDKRIYVWFDAVIGYLSASVEWAERRGEPDAWKAWWEVGADGAAPGRAYYFIGKDNVPFHAIIWPAMLMGYGGLALPFDVPANEFLTIGGQKLSSSRAYTARLPFLPEALELFDADALRFFLTINAPEGRDTDFSWDEFQRRNNDELVATYGNAVHRLLSFARSRFDGRVPTPTEPSVADRAMLALAADAFASVGTQIEGVHLREGLRLTMGLAQALNRYLDDAAPWKTIKTDPARAATAVWTALQIVGALRVLTAPFLPFSAQRLHAYLGEEGDVHALPWAPREVPTGTQLVPPQPLFRKLEDEELEGLLARLGPTEAAATGEPT
ncbi:MAG: Methionyl-tRNA synthetase [uncultured Thermomicrobiales bacterium]|uniref:Methionine--tRNA ligase n=1 Tax=uncultured Thermomicrobiales bacterium TaxID=1645740 RepID=A0A6J4UTL7_9BACT|nr:MAG: Methionyl-tRNA synthetase [uncultured Thermomicrobiales bacterium]